MKSPVCISLILSYKGYSLNFFKDRIWDDQIIAEEVPNKLMYKMAFRHVKLQNYYFKAAPSPSKVQAISKQRIVWTGKLRKEFKTVSKLMYSGWNLFMEYTKRASCSEIFYYSRALMLNIDLQTCKPNNRLSYSWK